MSENVTKSTENATPRLGGWVNAALAIAQGQPATVAAAAAGVHIRTIRRWVRKPHFQKLVGQYRDDLICQSLSKLVAANTDAIDTLTALLNDSQAAIRLGAAGRILSHALKAAELANVIPRLEQLERQHEAQKRGEL